MNHIKISIEAGEAAQEMLIGQLTPLSATGFEQTETQLLAYFEMENFQRSAVYGVLKKFDYQTTVVEAQNWNAAWERSFEPVVVPRFCAVRAHFHQPVPHLPYDVIITPKMSFGTGHHATTYMMLQHMQDLDFKNKSVLDFGSGTGLLAILAEKLGAAQVTAMDNDVWSFENMQENIRLNGCASVAALHTDLIPSHQTYDIVLANITKNTLMAYMGILKSSLRQNGHLLMSGLLEADEVEMVAATSKYGMKLVQKKAYNGWIALLFVN